METGFEKQEKWWESKITFLVMALAPLVAGLWFIAGIKTDIALIQQSIDNINKNHEQHIQDIFQEMKEMKAVEMKQQEEIIDIQKQILVLIKK